MHCLGMLGRKHCIHGRRGDCKASQAFQSLPCRWAVMNYAPGGDTYFTCCVNSSVHVAM